MSGITNTVDTALPFKANINTRAFNSVSLAAPNNSVMSTTQHHGWDRFIPYVETDRAFAKTMAKNAAFIPDKLLVNLNDAPPLNDAEAWRAWTNQSIEFDSVAAKVTKRRIEIYSDMKSQGSTDAEIFNALIAFNLSLHIDYQIKSGLIKLDTYA